MTSGRVALPEDCAGEIFAALSGSFPEEGCGLLVGRLEDGSVRIESVVPSPNIAEAREKTFEIDPGLRLRTQREARAAGLEIVGHYHSHPFGEPIPSDTDRGRAAGEPELVWLIMGLRWGGAQGLAAWRMAPGLEPERLALDIIEQGNAG
ncbi:Mov34/MPN/PAD-1 family protein [Minwuia thermotolerans]|nr:M67 family metallopeptidase [Minwuia thermotolerans]